MEIKNHLSYQSLVWEGAIWTFGIICCQSLVDKNSNFDKENYFPVGLGFGDSVSGDRCAGVQEEKNQLQPVSLLRPRQLLRIPLRIGSLFGRVLKQLQGLLGTFCCVLITSTLLYRDTLLHSVAKGKQYMLKRERESFKTCLFYNFFSFYFSLSGEIIKHFRWSSKKIWINQ